jgi:hypothetical protein
MPYIYPVLLVFLVLPSLLAEPQMTSWYTAASGRYANLYTSTAAETARNASTTWSRGQGNQANPTYAGIHQVDVSANWVYVHTTGLASYTMGPWYLNTAKTTDFPNFPANTATIYRIPRNPGAPPAIKTLTDLGAIGMFVDGVAMFDNRDSFSYSTASGADAEPMNGVTGDGVWIRDAFVNEGVTFDPGNAHQAGSQYHYHANPPGLRYQLGDHVDYDPLTNRYSEQTGLLKHSPILAWVRDGYPLYGPYGYSDADDASSAVVRMESGFRKRTITVRQTLPAHSARDQGYTTTGDTSEYTLAVNRYGPAVNATYVLGHYLEDSEYLGDLGFTQGVDFDLDLYNGRFCVTPEFPEGTYAYFVSIEADGTPKFPYNIGRKYFGNTTGGAVNTITEAVTNFFKGGPNLQDDLTEQTLQVSDDMATLSWSSVQGGTYTVEYSDDLTNWVSVTTNLMATGSMVQVESALASTDMVRYFRAARTRLAPFDDTGFDFTSEGGGGGGDGSVSPGTGTRGQTLTLTVDLTGVNPPAPPAQIMANAATVGVLSGSGFARPSATSISFTLTIPPGATPGVVDVTVAFPPPPGMAVGPSYTFAGAFEIL